MVEENINHYESLHGNESSYGCRIHVGSEANYTYLGSSILQARIKVAHVALFPRSCPSHSPN
jgi:hypothetical protein